MAFRLSKDQKARLRDLGDKLAEEKEKVDEVMADAVTKIEAELERIREAFREYVDLAVEAGGEVEGWADELNADWEDASTRWRDSERGEAAIQWIESIQDISNELSGLDVPDIEFTPPDDPEDYSETLGNIAEEPGQ